MGSCINECVPLTGAVDTMASGKLKAQKKRKASATTVFMNEDLDTPAASSSSSRTARFRKDVVALSKDGQLLENGVFKLTISKQTMTILGSLGIRLDKLKLHRDGYVMGSNSGSKLESLHTLIAASKQDADYVTLSAAGCPDLKKNLVVAHLDDNPLNFSIENLTWVSSKMNHWCKKSTQVRD